MYELHANLYMGKSENAYAQKIWHGFDEKSAWGIAHGELT